MKKVIINKDTLLGFNNSKFRMSTITINIFLILLAVICVLPFYMMIINATHSNGEITKGLNLIPGKYLIDNYIRMSASTNIWGGFFNSLIIAVSSTALNAYFSALTAYGFSKYKFKGNNLLFMFVLGTMMIPGQLGLIGFFQLNKILGTLNTFIPLIIPSIATAGTVFFIKQYMDSSIPNTLIEAARIDGCSEFRTFNKIILPLVTPCIATISIFNFVGSWNNFLVPMVFLFDKDMFTLPILIANLRGVYARDFGATYLGIAISVVPIMIVFACLSKYILGGLTMGSVKE